MPALKNKPKTVEDSSGTLRRNFLLTAGLGAFGAVAIANPADAAEAEPVTLDDQISLLLRDRNTKTAQNINNKTAVFHVDDFALDKDASDSYRWQRAVDAAKAYTVPQPGDNAPRSAVVRGGSKTYLLGTVINCTGLKNTVIEGAGENQTHILGMLHVTLPAAFVFPSSGEDTEDIIFRNLNFRGSLQPTSLTAHERDGRVFATEGTTTMQVTQTGLPGQARGLMSGILPYGARVRPSNEGRKKLRNVIIENCHFWGLPSLPVIFAGVEGTAIFRNNFVYRCLDVGFTYNESVTCIGNRVEWSGDNGISLSRGNDRVISGNNNIYGSYFNGIWTTGYTPGTVEGAATVPGTAGPAAVVVVGNMIDFSAMHGISVENGGKVQTISGNTITNTRRIKKVNYSGQPYLKTDGVGIFVQGLEGTIILDDDGDGFTDFERLAATLNITGNTITDADRGGIIIEGGQNILVTSNLIMRPGRLKGLNNDAITTSNGTYNVGISSPGDSASIKNVFVTGNLIVDDRTANGTVAPSSSRIDDVAASREGIAMYYGVRAGLKSKNWVYYDNVVVGSISPYVESARRVLGSNTVIGGTDPTSDSTLTFDHAHSKQGLLVFSENGIPRFDILHRGKDVADFGKGNWVYFRGYSIEGVKQQILKMNMITGQVILDAPIKLPIAAERPSAVTYGPGAMFYDQKLRKPIFSDGTVWRTADGLLAP